MTVKDYLVELLLDDDAEFMEALSALDSLEGEYIDKELFPDPCIFQLLLDLIIFVGEFFSVWVAVVLEDNLECLH